MKILFLGPSNSIHLKRWVKFFSENGWDVYYCGFKSEFNEYEKFLKDKYIINPNLKKIIKLFEYRKILKISKPDIINFHYIDYWAVASLFSYDIPVVLSGWGDDFLLDPYKTKIFRKFLKIICNKATLVTSIAEHMSDVLTDYVGVKKKKILTSSWGCDTSIFYQNNEIKKNDNVIRIIHPRGFVPVYNWKTVIRAIPLLLNKSNKKYEYIFTNVGPEESQAKELVKNMNIGHIVKFLGFVEPKELAQEFNKSHIYVSMAISDGNNISLNEAMACGAFPICSDTPATKQWIKNNYNGYILKDNYSASELADLIIKYSNEIDFVTKVKEINFSIVKEKADFKTNLLKIENKFKEIIKEKR